MHMKGTQRIEARRARVWAALNDDRILQLCIPGCQEIERLSDAEMKAIVVIRIGPVKASFAGRVTLSDLSPPNSYTIAGEGQGGLAGFAKGSAQIRLLEDGNFTVLAYEANVQIGGKLAQLGARLIDSTAKKLTAEFFEKFGVQAVALDRTDEGVN